MKRPETPIGNRRIFDMDTIIVRTHILIISIGTHLAHLAVTESQAHNPICGRTGSGRLSECEFSGNR